MNLCIFIHNISIGSGPDNSIGSDPTNETLYKKEGVVAEHFDSARRIVKHGTVPGIYSGANFRKYLRTLGSFAVARSVVVSASFAVFNR
jgi:hypothetical protein